MDSKDLDMGVLRAAEVQDKPWGTTQRLLAASGVRVHRIKVNKGGRCSIHRHRYQFNMFVVEAGTLQIYVYRDNQLNGESPVVERTPHIERTYTLTSGLATTVPPGFWHSFEGLEDCVGLELYFSEAAESDIERFS